MKKIVKHKRVILTMDITFTDDKLEELQQRGYNTDDEKDIEEYCYNVAQEALLERDLDYFDWTIQDVFVS
jgi:hypothetical protein